MRQKGRRMLSTEPGAGHAGGLNAAGISVVRNEADVIGATIRHHFNEGFDFLLVADNDSTDGTPALLEGMAREDRRLRISKAAGAFRQSDILTSWRRMQFGLVPPG